MNSTGLLFALVTSVAVYYLISFFQKKIATRRLKPAFEMVCLAITCSLLVLIFILASAQLTMIVFLLTALFVSTAISLLTFYKYSIDINEAEDEDELELMLEDSQKSDSVNNVIEAGNFNWTLRLFILAIAAGFLLKIFLNLSVLSFFVPFSITIGVGMGALGLMIDILLNRFDKSSYQTYLLAVVNIAVLSLWNEGLNPFDLRMPVIYSFIMLNPIGFVSGGVGSWAALFIFSYLPTFFLKPELRFEKAVFGAALLTILLLLVELAR